MVRFYLLGSLIGWAFFLLLLFVVIYGAVRLALKHDRASQVRVPPAPVPPARPLPEQAVPERAPQRPETPEPEDRTRAEGEPPPGAPKTG
ncbi:hypothetical protein Sme01_57290 [Sphaerisporangium melleum]|uniref:Uncharacterized protein n=1 Tax=Sphaerisporangium melleum TaxID=321316 RepID=A0A917R8D6_9ACTN|nr:hypothetical protein GCM10007964_41170 [Sphaerisporangium melleum]GII73253.1 hypothetical protein Sme01_57290 [Sphaerisporangium melleum]